VYDRTPGGPTRVVSLLPGDVTPAAGEDAFYQGASKDGAIVAFKVKGTLYVRIDNASTEKVTEAESTFGGFSDDGRYLFYVTGGNIHRFDTETKADVEVSSSGDAKMVRVAADGSHVYFISEQQLDGSKGTVGQPNLYVWSGGTVKFIATVAAGDPLGNWTTVISSNSGNGGNKPGNNWSRTTPNGGVLVFVSKAQLTSYDNAGHREVYRYEREGEELACVSCNPEGTAATADARLQDPNVANVVSVIDNLSEDGRRVFFETSEALLEGDEDGVNDIYEWQQPAGGGAPELNLISSGQSAAYAELEGRQDPNTLMGITPDGSDVFFRAQDALLPQAGVGGAQAIYDARVGGGFPQPPAPSVCVEESCRPPLTPPPLLGVAASSGLRGRGNVRPAKKHRKARHCRGAKRHKRCARKRPIGSVSKAASEPRAGTGSWDSTGTDSAASTRVVRGASATSVRSGIASAINPENGVFEKYCIESAAAKTSTSLAAHHPDFTTNIDWCPEHSGFSPQTESVAVELPPGLYGNPNLTPRCPTGKFVSNECPPDTQVGISRLKLKEIPAVNTFPVYNLAPPHPEAEIARFGISVTFFAIFIDVSVRTASDYGVTATIHDAPATFPVETAETTFWADPASSSHDTERVPPGPSGLPPAAFMTNSSACQSQEVRVSATSYQFPGQVFSGSAPMEPTTGCEGLPFEPSFEAHPTSRVAGAPTGLKTALTLPQQSSEDVEGAATATMREAKVTLPAGMAISASAADGLAACSDEAVHFHQELDAQCPDASKLGTATIASPALPRPLQGTLYQRSPQGKGHLFGLWLVSDDLGLHIKIPGEIEPDPNTGQLTAVFSGLPQVPVEEIDFDIWGGPRAPLKNPDSCGTYSTAFSFTPHSNDPPVTGQTQMTIDEGCGAPGFSPQLHGGATKPVAGAFSPFLLDLFRGDREQNLAGFEVALPKGELAKLKGVQLCPDAQAATGACPAASRVGSLVTAAGPGPDPLWLPQPGKAQPAVYLAGPYKGAPYSIVAVVPAQAGPFDLGNVVARSALAVDPETVQVTVRTDPLPQFVEGVPVIYRRLHALIDRPEFSLNPTNCSEQQITSNVSSTLGTIAHPADRFQVDDCKALGFKPKLSLQLKGGTERGDFPALTATLRARRGDANLGKVAVTLPHTEFLAQEHIVTICTRVRFAAHNCPKGSVYGRAKAWTPLLDKPLEGPVYLRSNPTHELPDLVMDLKGQIEVVVPARIDSVNQGIRTSFEAVPDAPISKVVLRMRGGKKSLLTNSADLCARKHHAVAKLRAQNGRAATLHPVLGVKCRH
ncbi:MAG: TolB family protein, partial [Solirubrobacterales bacterium]